MWPCDSELSLQLLDCEKGVDTEPPANRGGRGQVTRPSTGPRWPGTAPCTRPGRGWRWWRRRRALRRGGAAESVSRPEWEDGAFLRQRLHPRWGVALRGGNHVAHAPSREWERGPATTISRRGGGWR